MAVLPATKAKSLSDIGILNSPGDMAIVVLILGWPLLLAGAGIGAAIGWRIGRRRRPWLGLAAGVLAGVGVSAAGFAAWATWSSG